MTLAKKIRIKDIAALAKVSEGTVDRVLHNRGEVSEETRKHVLDIVKKMKYTPNLLAKSLASKKQNKIAVLIPQSDVNSAYWDKPLEGVKKAAEETATFNTLTKPVFFDLGSESSFTNAYKDILKEPVDGVIMDPVFPGASQDFIHELEKNGIPYIFIDANIDNCRNIAYFGQNAVQSGHAAARLMHLGLKDHSHILVLKLASGNNINLHLMNREKGFLSFFQHDTNHKNIDVFFAEVDVNRQGEPEKSLLKILQQTPRISGIYVTNSKAFKVASFLEKHQSEKVLLGGYDLIQENISYMEKGYIDFLIGQKPEEQGYNSVMAMFNFLYLNRLPLKINHSPIDIVMIDNLDYYKAQ